MKIKKLLGASLMMVVLPHLAAIQGATHVVTTADNANPGTGTSLVMALQSLGDGDTIAFNIPGPGPHYIKTPPDGYPLITRNNVTIDGYTQPGSAPNTNSIHQPNSAKLMIVLDSREGGRTKMNYNTGRPGYGDSENAILGVFNAANVTIKGLCFLGLHTTDSDEDPAIYCIAFARDHTGGPNYDDNGHVAGCWFGVEPDGTSVTGGSAAAVTAFRHRDESGGELPELPNRNLTLGVKAGSANPRAEFNVMVGMSYHLAGEQIGARVSGNFIGILPDGVTPYDMTLEGRPFAGASLEIGRYNDSTILIGTDGDGVNDADEGNVFGPLSDGQPVLSFYSTGNKTFIIAGNYFGVAVDGVTPLPGSFRIVGEFGGTSIVRFGSDLNGVSDAVEGNVVVNNHPFSPDPFATFNPIYASAGVKLSVRGNTLVNNYPLPVNMAGLSLGLSNPDPETFYAEHLVDPTVIQPVITSAGTELVGTAPVPVETFVATIIDLYVADQEGITNGQSLNIPELPNGFVQGKRYVQSFVDNSPADQDPAVGAFRFNIASLGLGGNQVTITANYSEQAPGSTNAVVVTSPFSEPVLATGPAGGTGADLSIEVAGPSSLRLSWSGGTGPFLVQRKGALSDTNWMNVLTTAESSALVPNDGAAGFFRVVNSANTTVTPINLIMSSASEIPPVAVPSTGIGRGTVSLEGNTLAFDIHYSGLTTNAHLAHIHGITNTTGSAGVRHNLAPFNGGSFGQGGRLAGAVTLTDEERAALIAGDLYVNIHTPLNGPGEIRGQLIPAVLKATLNGANERDPVDTPATGTGVFTLVGDDLFVDVNYTGLKGNITNAHIHGPADTETSAGVLMNNIVPLHVGPMDGTAGRFLGRVTVTPAQLAHIIDGLTYFNIHSSAHTGGEIRGQIVP